MFPHAQPPYRPRTAKTIFWSISSASVSRPKIDLDGNISFHVPKMTGARYDRPSAGGVSACLAHQSSSGSGLVAYMRYRSGPKALGVADCGFATIC